MSEFHPETAIPNPEPNSRNMEFDPKRNLFINLKPSEQVFMP